MQVYKNIIDIKALTWALLTKISSSKKKDLEDILDLRKSSDCSSKERWNPLMDI